jgi:lipoate-protein ligase A
VQDCFPAHFLASFAGNLKYLDFTFPSPAANLACDEVLLDACDGNPADEVLRFWEPRHYFVVLGYGNQAAREVHLDACRERNIGIYRRCSGGGTVVQGPDCLNYSLVVGLDRDPALQTITTANRFIMERHRQALEKLLGRKVQVQGITDLAVENKKFSGNAQRRKRRALLFHGTFLLGFDLSLVQKLLPLPSRQPNYRYDRTHEQFLANINVPAAAIKTALRETWRATDFCEGPPEIPSPLANKYGSNEWNLKSRS